MALYQKYLNKKKTKFFKCLKDMYDTSESERFDATDLRLDSLNFFLYYFNENHKSTLDTMEIKIGNVNNINYNIIKERFTDTWLFVCKSLIVFYIKEEDFEDFYLTFLFSSEYKMVIYKTESYYIIFCTSHTSQDVHDVKRLLLYHNSDIRYLILSYFINEQETMDETKINNEKDITNEIDIENTNETEDIWNSIMSLENNYDIQIDECDINDINIYKNEVVKHIIYPDYLQYHGLVVLNNDILSKLDKLSYSLTYHCTIGYGCENQDLISIIDILLQYLKYNTYLPPHFLTLD